jgi:translation elongation factor EF-1alpha
MEEKEIGYVSHYFDHISVAAVEITDGTVEAGDTLHIKGHTTDLQTKVESMQIEHESVSKAKKGDSIGVKVGEKVRINDKVFKVIGG